MRLFAYLFPGLVQLRRGRWVVGLALSATLAALVILVVGTELYLRRLHRELREVAPRSVARQLWDEKDDLRHGGAMALLALVVLGALDGALVGAGGRERRRRPTRHGQPARAPEARDAPGDTPADEGGPADEPDEGEPAGEDPDGSDDDAR